MRSRHVEGDAAHAEAVGAVGRELDLDGRVGQPEVLRQRRADRCIGGKFEQAGGIRIHAQFLGRAQHAGRLHAAQLGRLDGDAAGKVRADDGQRRLQACTGIGRAADDLHRCRCPCRPGRPAGGRLRDAFRALMIRATTTPSSDSPSGVTSSTSRPIAVSVAASSSREAVVGTWWRSQFSENFMGSRDSDSIFGVRTNRVTGLGTGPIPDLHPARSQANCFRNRTSLSKKLRRSSTP